MPSTLNRRWLCAKKPLKYNSCQIQQNMIKYKYKESDRMDKKLKRIQVLKIICTVMYTVVTVFLATVFLIIFPDLYGVEHDAEALVAIIMFFVVFPMSVIYLISAALSVWGLSISYRFGQSKSNTYFIIFTFAPIITGVVNFFAFFWLL